MFSSPWVPFSPLIVSLNVHLYLRQATKLKEYGLWNQTALGSDSSRPLAAWGAYLHFSLCPMVDFDRSWHTEGAKNKECSLQALEGGPYKPASFPNSSSYILYPIHTLLYHMHI